MSKFCFDNGKNLFETYDKPEIDEKTGKAVLSGVLTAGDSTITLESPFIDENSSFDFYTSIYGINPSSVVVDSGEITLRFDPISLDLGVKVRVL